MAYLMGLSGPVKGRKIELDKDRVSIGRNPANDIVLADEAASSQHCTIAKRGDRYVLRDLNSTNGTFLNLEPLKNEVELKPKNVIQIGSCEFIFDGYSEENAGQTSAPVTKVIVDIERPVINPSFFESISPFGTRRKSSRSLGALVFILIGLAVIISFVLFFSILMAK